MNSPQRRDSVADSIADALDPLETHHASDPSAPVPLGTQILRFTLTGALSAVVDFGLLVLLSRMGMDPTVAKAFSFVAGTTSAYLINRRWTFEAEPSRSRFLAVVALYGVMFAVQVGLFHVIFTRLIDAEVSTFWAKAAAFVVAQGVATVVNFIVQRTVIFKLI